MTIAYHGQPPGIAGTWYGQYPIGVRGADVPSGGLAGPSLMYPLLDLPAEDDDLFRYVVTTAPPGLTYFTWTETGVTEAEGPDGIHAGTADLYKNGALAFEFAFEFVFGTVVDGDAVLDSMGAAGVLGQVGELTGDAALDGVGAAAGTLDSAAALSGGATLDGVTAAGGAESAAVLSGDAALASMGAGGTVGGPEGLAGNVALDSVGAGGTLADAGPSALGGAATLDSVAAGGDLLVPGTYTDNPAAPLVLRARLRAVTLLARRRGITLHAAWRRLGGL